MRQYNTYIADMDEDDLLEYRELMAKENALMLGADVPYTEAVEVFIAITHIDSYILDKYGIDNRRDWTVDILTGKIYYTDDAAKRVGGPVPRGRQGQ